jgi:uncharacterized protein YraI
MARSALPLLSACLLMLTGMLPVHAQSSPDAWTVYELNLRAGPGGTHQVLDVLPPSTALLT